MASASDHRAHAALQPADCLILLPQRLPAAVETSIGPAHYPAECTQSDAFLQPSLRARKGRANSNSLHGCRATGPVRRACSPARCICRARSILRWLYGVKGSSFSVPLFAGVFAIFGHGNVAGLGRRILIFLFSRARARARARS